MPWFGLVLVLELSCNLCGLDSTYKQRLHLKKNPTILCNFWYDEVSVRRCVFNICVRSLQCQCLRLLGMGKFSGRSITLKITNRSNTWSLLQKTVYRYLIKKNISVGKLLWNKRKKTLFPYFNIITSRFSSSNTPPIIDFFSPVMVRPMMFYSLLSTVIKNK